MKIATINMLLSICLGWAVVFYFLFYIPERVYDNPAPTQMSYNIAAGEEETAVVAPSKAEISLNERLLNGDVEHGKKLFSECATCHAVQKNGTNRVGPPLWDIVGRKFAAQNSFGYSRAMRRAGEEDKHWDFETLFIYLHSPQRFVKGTTMSYNGVKGEQDRADLILYLRSLSDVPVALVKDTAKSGDAQKDGVENIDIQAQ